MLRDITLGQFFPGNTFRPRVRDRKGTRETMMHRASSRGSMPECSRRNTTNS